MKKKWFLIIIVLLLTGCNVEYNIDINKNSVVEKVTIYETQDVYNVYTRTSKLNVLKELLSYNKSNLDDNNYNYEIVGKKDPYIVISKEYKDISDYCQNTIFYKNFFGNLKCDSKNDIYTIETLDYEGANPENPEKFYVDNLDISVKSYYKIGKSNSLDIDKKKNIHKWNDIDDEFNINLAVDTNHVFISSIYYYIGIIIMIIIISWIIVIYYYKKQKKDIGKKKM